MDKLQAEVEKQIIENEKQVLKELKNNYTKALKEIKQRIKELQSSEITQSKIYQIQYQQNLERQLTALIDVLSNDNINSINEYLAKTYKDGFIGTQYHMQSEGVPFIMPLDQESIVKSIQKKTEDLNLSQRLYKNANELKKTIKAEISRGLSPAFAYSKIARNISLCSEADMNKAYRIARTEGGRVQSESKYEAMKRAKKNGADIVKQWDSTLDNRTRETHARLDGQVQELDEPFKISGKEAMYPHSFGIAAEDINCRCVVLERARSVIESEGKFTKIVDGNLVEFEDVKSYNDFKKKYFDFYDTSFNSATSTLEALKRIESVLGCTTKVATFTLDSLNEELRAIEDFSKDYPEIKGYIQHFWKEDNDDAGGSFGIYNHKGDVINILKMQNYSLDEWNELINVCIENKFFFKRTTLYSLQIHELAHALDNYAYNILRGNIKDGKYIGTIKDGGTKLANNFAGHISSKIIEEAKNELFGTTNIESIKEKIEYLGTYALKSDAEMFAQCLAYEYSGQSNIFSKKVKDLFEKRLHEIVKGGWG